MPAPLLISALLTLGVLFVNGWTDAPNAIATAVSTRALPYRRAVLLAAVCNLAGCICATAISGAVAATIFELADFSSAPHGALSALCAAMAAVILWATLAWRFGLPTSESHALLAGLSGAAVALQGDLSCLRWEPWCKALLGLLFSLLAGFLLARFIVNRLPRQRGNYRRWQVVGAALMAFAHGAQDGQKFLGIRLLAVSLAAGGREVRVTLPLILLCALTMALGTALGGRRIIETVGEKLAPLTPRAGFAADLSGGVCLLISTLLGAPVSTTHTKAAAILGAGSAEGQASRAVAAKLMLAWLLTFPTCGVLAFGIAKIIL